MKDNKLTVIKWLFIIFYVIGVFFYVKKIIQPELHFHFQQPPFLTNLDFFVQYLNYPGGIAEYLAAFFMQFFYYSGIGALVIMFIGCVIIFTGYKIFEIFEGTGNSFWAIFVPFALFISLLNNYFFPFSIAVKITLVFCAVWLFILLIRKYSFTYIIYILLAIIVYYVSGSGALLVFSLSALIAAIQIKGLKESILLAISVVLVNILVPYATYYYILNISPNSKYLSFLPNLPKYMRYAPNVEYNMFCYALPVLSFILVIVPYIFNRGNTQQILSDEKVKPKEPHINSPVIRLLILMVVVVGFSYVLLKKTHNQHEKNVVLADYYSYNEQWEEVVGVAISDPEYDVYINYNYNRAINNTGHFLDLYFDYPQLMGVDGLFPDRMSVDELTLISSDYYWDMGYIDEAQHWAYEALTARPYSKRALERIVLTNLVKGYYDGARKYLMILEDNMLSKNFVDKYMPYVNDTMLEVKDKMIQEKRALTPKNIEVSDNIVGKFEDLLKYNPLNKKANEHMQMFYMLNHQLGNFMQYLEDYSKFYNEYPEIFEQAIALYIVKTDFKLFKKYKISKKTQRIFIEYTKILRSYGNDKNRAKADLSQYSNTYFYYTMFNSPLITNAKVRAKTEKDTNY
jgi:tetratricopeptide (TPR) repeat protein